MVFQHRDLPAGGQSAEVDGLVDEHLCCVLVFRILQHVPAQRLGNRADRQIPHAVLHDRGGAQGDFFAVDPRVGEGIGQRQAPALPGKLKLLHVAFRYGFGFDFIERPGLLVQCKIQRAVKPERRRGVDAENAQPQVDRVKFGADHDVALGSEDTVIVDQHVGQLCPAGDGLGRDLRAPDLRAVDGGQPHERASGIVADLGGIAAAAEVGAAAQMRAVRLLIAAQKAAQPFAVRLLVLQDHDPGGIVFHFGAPPLRTGRHLPGPCGAPRFVRA